MVTALNHPEIKDVSRIIQKSLQKLPFTSLTDSHTNHKKKSQGHAPSKASHQQKDSQFVYMILKKTELLG